jgi:hypothetical protein
MNNFVSISCPYCNAPVNINVNQKTGTCEYCGREFVCQDALKSPQYKDYQQYQNEKQLQGDDW